MRTPNALDWKRARARLADGQPRDWGERRQILKALALGCLGGPAGFGRAMIRVLRKALTRDVKAAIGKEDAE